MYYITIITITLTTKLLLLRSGVLEVKEEDASPLAATIMIFKTFIAKLIAFLQSNGNDDGTLHFSIITANFLEQYNKHVDCPGIEKVSSSSSSSS